MQQYYSFWWFSYSSDQRWVMKFTRNIKRWRITIKNMKSSRNSWKVKKNSKNSWWTTLHQWSMILDLFPQMHNCQNLNKAFMNGLTWWKQDFSWLNNRLKKRIDKNLINLRTILRFNSIKLTANTNNCLNK